MKYVLFSLGIPADQAQGFCGADQTYTLTVDPAVTTFRTKVESRALPALNTDDVMYVGKVNRIFSAAFGGYSNVEIEPLGPSTVRYKVVSEAFGEMEYTDVHRADGFSSTLKVVKTGNTITDEWTRDPMIAGWYECVEPAKGKRRRRGETDRRPSVN